MTDYYYKCLPKRIYQNGEYTLQAIQPEHVEKIRIWRNAQIDVLRQKEQILPNDQIEYFKNNVWPEMENKKPKNILLAYTMNRKLIGYGGLVHISWSNYSAESSFILDNKIDHHSEKYNLYIKNFFLMLKILAFNELKFLKITSETFNNRKRHIQLLEEIGFKKLPISSEANSVFHELLAE